MNINLNQKRQQLLCDKPGPCAAVVFSGRAPMRSADGAYPFSVDRDFYYLTGIDHENMIFGNDQGPLRKDQRDAVYRAVLMKCRQSGSAAE